MKQTEFLLRLKLQKNIGYQKMLAIVEAIGNIETVELSLLQNLELSDTLKELAIAAFNNPDSQKKVGRILQQCQVITFFDDIYPMQLREIYRPPLVLFARGNLELLRSKIVVIVGSRYPTSYSRYVLTKLMPNIKQQGYVVASGLARGVDAIAHETALKFSKQTIAVIGNGLNHFYPQENYELQKQIIKDGLLLSEYLPDTPPRPFRFPERNRILAGLCEHVIVTEAKEKSGSLITANMALQENRNIFAVPGPISSALASGPNQLITAGAIPIVNAEKFAF